MEGNCIIPT